MRFYLLIIVVLFLVSCSDVIKIETSFEDGTKMEEYTILKKQADQKLKHGVYNRYDESGNLVETSNYVNGLLEGSRILYFPSGKKEVNETYEGAAFHGPYTAYYASGNLKEAGQYVWNVMTGAWKFYYDLDGEVLREEVHFVENVENGPYREYYENGNIKAEGIYSDELDDGPFKGYHENGTLMMEGAYVNGRKEGIFKEYNASGELEAEKEYKNGFRIEE